TYTVIVSSGDTGGDEPGDYQITLVKAPGTFTISTGDEGGALALGNGATGRIHMGDVDVWTFSATQGSSITIAVSEVGTNTAFVPWIHLVRPDGTVITNAYHDTLAQVTITAPTTGTYYIIISSGDTGADAPGDYRVTRTGGSP